MKKIARGAYMDADGALHLDAAEMLRAAGMPVTARNRRAITDELRRMMREQFPDALVEETDERISGAGEGGETDAID